MKNINKKHILTIFLLAVSLLLCACGQGSDSAEGDESSSETQATNLSWGEGITTDVPRFDGTADSTEFPEGAGYAADYYSNVTMEQAEDYIQKLEETCGIAFSDSKFPKTAVFGDKIIAIHYNVTEMKLSVTVTEKTK